MTELETSIQTAIIKVNELHADSDSEGNMPANIKKEDDNEDNKEEDDNEEKRKRKLSLERIPSGDDSDVSEAREVSGDRDSNDPFLAHVKTSRKLMSEKRKDGGQKDVMRTYYDCRHCKWGIHVRRQMSQHLQKKHKIALDLRLNPLCVRTR